MEKKVGWENSMGVPQRYNVPNQHYWLGWCKTKENIACHEGDMWLILGLMWKT